LISKIKASFQAERTLFAPQIKASRGKLRNQRSLFANDPEVGDPDNGIEPGTAFEDIPEDWVCPICGVGKDEFSEE